MIDNFPAFAASVATRFDAMSGQELFVVDVDDLFDTYLAAFPEGTNPIFRERTEHDCSCCKNFVRNLGKVVAIKDGEIQTVWDANDLPPPYDVVAETMRNVLRQAPIKSVFRTKESKYGNEHNIDDDGHRWNHFHGHVKPEHKTPKPEEARGELDAVAQVMRRGLEELSADAIDSVIDLITANALYRGQEHLASITAFQALKREYDAAPSKSLFIWSHLKAPAARFRNTVIGTLIVDLSEGVDIERAVGSFEAKVAPQNYKRPTALITPKMIENAMTELNKLGLEGAVERRMAKLSDVSVNNVLFVDNSVQAQMKDGLTGKLMEAVKPQAIDIKHAQEISAEDFLSQIVPKAKSIGLLLKNTHLSNFMTLTAPVHDDTGQLFKWDNDFAWSYDGEVTDSIKERVKRAGGNVTNAALRCSLAWHNFDDLDLHVQCPDGHIYYGNKMDILDVDMNAGHGHTRTPVENLSWTSGRLRNGTYKIWVNQFSKRENTNLGFELELEFRGLVHQFSYSKAVSGDVQCLELTFVGDSVEVKVAPGLVGGSIPTTKWGLTTEQLVPVDLLMLSPNHWDGQTQGNKHWFFILKDCKNPDSVRGLYNEFLRATLDKHRKVFEVLGAKTKCPSVDEQLSGVGFSSTRGDTVTAVVKGNGINKAYNIVF